MKNDLQMRCLLFLVTTIGLLGSCQKDNPDKATYVAYSLNGASCNGAYRIETDKDMSTLDATAVVTPETETDPEVIFLTFYDYADEREVAFIIPRNQGNPYLLVHDSEFGMAVFHQTDGCVLTSGVENTVNGVSIEIKNFKHGKGVLGLGGSVAYMEGYFVGIMSYKNEMNEIEPHTVEGDFVYNENDVF